MDVNAHADMGLCCRRIAPLLLDWAVMEADAGALDVSRQLMARAAQVDPSHAPVFAAWAALEKAAGNVQLAEEIARRVPERRLWAADPDAGARRKD